MHHMPPRTPAPRPRHRDPHHPPRKRQGQRMNGNDLLATVVADIEADYPEPPAWLVRVGRMLICPTCGGRPMAPVWLADDFMWTLPWPHDAECPDAGTPMPIRDPF